MMANVNVVWYKKGANFAMVRPDGIAQNFILSDSERGPVWLSTTNFRNSDFAVSVLKKNGYAKTRKPKWFDPVFGENRNLFK